MAKRKYRMTEHEIDIHKRAVALRKMTDEQLVNEVDGKNKFSTVVLRSDIDEGTIKELLQAHKENTQPREGVSEDKALKVPTKLDTLLQELANGSVKGVGKVTTEKLIEYCLEKGYSKFGMREV